MVANGSGYLSLLPQDLIFFFKLRNIKSPVSCEFTNDQFNTVRNLIIKSAINFIFIQLLWKQRIH